MGGGAVLDWSLCALSSQAGVSGWELSPCLAASGNAGCGCRGRLGDSVGRVWGHGRHQAQLMASLPVPPLVGAPVPRVFLPGASVPGVLVGIREAGRPEERLAGAAGCAAPAHWENNKV